MVKKLKMLLALLVACMPVACTKHTITGKFIVQTSKEVDLLDIAEAPAGHLSGSLTVSTIDKDGSRNKDVNLNVTGSLYQGNISLQIGDSGILSRSMNAVGKFSGDTLDLNLAGSHQVFTRTTSRKYAAALVSLNTVGYGQQTMKDTLKSIKDYDAYLTTLNSDLQNFVGWADLRIEHEQNARRWYADRALIYQKCVDTVKSLGLQHVPSWKWQSCVLSINNDNYDRQQVADQISQIQRQAADEEQAIDARIANIQNQITSNESNWNQSCPHTSSEAACKAAVQEFANELPSYSLNAHIEAYKNILPALAAAIDQNMQAKADGEKRLSALQGEADNILRNAH